MTDERGSGPDRSSGSNFSLVRFEREIFPFLQSTQWIPGEEADERDRLAGAYDIVFPHGLIEKVRRQAKKLPEGDMVGVFYGAGCECPWTRRLWIRVDDVVVETHPARRGLFRRRSRTADERPVGERIEAVRNQGDPPPGHQIGWFRTRRTDALVMFASESETLARSFREPWHFAVLLPAPGTDGAYGVFGRDEDGQIRDRRARPFYEREAEGRTFRAKTIAPPNYRLVERARELPGRSGTWREVQRKRAPAIATAACTVFGVAGGLALSYELDRATGPGGFLAREAMAFTSPEDGVEEAAEPTPEEQIRGHVETFDSNVARFRQLINRPSSATTYCDDLRSAYNGVQAALVTLIAKRDELDAGSQVGQVELAIQAKGRVDARFERSGCR